MINQKLFIITFGFVLGGAVHAQRRGSIDLDALKAKPAHQGLREVYQFSAQVPRDVDLAARRALLDHHNLLHLGLIERMEQAKSGRLPKNEYKLIGEAVLILGAYEYLTRHEESVSQSSEPALMFARSIAAARRGDLRAAQALNPGLGAIRSLGAAAEFKARVNLGTISFGLGRNQEALQILQSVRGSGFDDGLIPLQRARIMYDSGRLADALNELLSVPRSSPSWHSGMLVASWAAYRGDDPNLALGILMSLHSPYLASKFSPETRMLEAAVLYSLCYNTQSEQVLSSTKKDLRGLSSAFASFERSFGDRFQSVIEVFDYSRGVRAPKAGMSARAWGWMMDGLLRSEALSEMDRSYSLSTRERRILTQMGLQSNRFERAIRRNFDEQIQSLRNDYLRYSRRALITQLSELRREITTTLEGALAIEVELNTRRRERLIRGEGSPIPEIELDAQVRKGFEFWPFQGEYWRDEGGSYFFATADVCQEGER